MMQTQFSKINVYLFAPALFLAALAAGGCSENEALLDPHRDDVAEEKVSEESHESSVLHRGPGDAHSGGVILTEAQKARIQLRLAKARPGSLARKLSFPGEIGLNQDSLIKLTPRVSGLISEVLVTRGDRVEQGQLLAVMESPVIGEVKASFLDAASAALLNKEDLDRFTEIQKNTRKLIRFLDSEPELSNLEQEDFGDMSDYGSRLVRSYAEYSVSKKAFERKKNLYEKRITSQKEFLEVQGIFEMSRAEYLAQLADTRFALEQEILSRTETYQASLFSMKAAERQLGILGLSEEEIQRFSSRASTDSSSPAAESRGRDLTRVLIRSPRDGNILERHVSPGEKVDADTAIFNMADLDQVWARLQVPSRDLEMVKTGQRVTITSESGAETTGTISVIGPLVSEDTRTADVRVILDNHSGDWKPGLFVRGSLELPEIESRLLVPRDALQNINGEDFVFVPSGEDTFITAPVVTGRTDGTSVEIVSGLESGMEYVAEGAFELKAIIITGAMDPHAGHGH